jgi:hypothetical protein
VQELLAALEWLLSHAEPGVAADRAAFAGNIYVEPNIGALLSLTVAHWPGLTPNQPSTVVPRSPPVLVPGASFGVVATATLIAAGRWLQTFTQA